MQPDLHHWLPAATPERSDGGDLLGTGTQELPPGCAVTYELEAVEILKPLLTRVAGTTRRAWSSWRPDEILAAYEGSSGG